MGWSDVFSGALSIIPGAGQVKGILEMASGVAGAIGGDTGKKIEKGAQELAEGLQEADQQELSPEKQTELEKLANEHKERMRELGLQDVQGARSFAATELKSDDKYVRRTRPEMVRFTVKGGIAYIFLSTLALCLLSIFDLISGAEADLLFQFLKYQSGFVVGMIYMVFRTYTTRRSQDKAMEKMGTMPEGIIDKATKLLGKGKG